MFGVLYELLHEDELLLLILILQVELVDEHEQMDEYYGYQLEILSVSVLLLYSDQSDEMVVMDEMVLLKTPNNFEVAVAVAVDEIDDLSL